MKYRNGETPLHVWRTDHETFKYVSMTEAGEVHVHSSTGKDDLDHKFDLIETYQAEPTWQYYCMDHNCPASGSNEPNCICWHDEGENPHWGATRKSKRKLQWRKKPTEIDQPEQPPAACSPSPIESDQVLEGP